MKPVVVLTASVALIALWSRPVPAEDLTLQIVGIWKVKASNASTQMAKSVQRP